MKEKKLVIEARIRTDPEFRIRCLLKLYEKQEEEEQEMHDSTFKNKQGFTKGDAYDCTSLAKYILNGNSVKDNSIAHTYLSTVLIKYITQLCNYFTEDDLLT